MTRHTSIRLGLLAWAVALLSCGWSRDRVSELSRDLARYPEYALSVEDARVDEGFSPDYFLRFRVLTAAGSRVAGQDSATVVHENYLTEWYPVSRRVFARYENYVGMVVASKTRDGKQTGPQQAYPAGYQYVGNPRYGSWGAGGFWQFYGQYALMRDLMGGWRVNRGDYGDFRGNRDGGQPYYGPRQAGGRPTFGSQGTQTQKTKPSFYQRHSQRLKSSRQAFATKARSRTGRTSSGWGRGSTSRGK